jgi:predicted enzyme related to lactoylglutathione lyase
MAGEIIHVEFPSGDFAKSSEFFQTLFGWRAEGEQAQGHLAIHAPGGVQASWVRSALAYAPGPVVFVAVADVARTCAEARRIGGRVLAPKMSLVNRGAFALLADPDGNVFAVIGASPGKSAPDAQTTHTEAGAASGSSPAASKTAATGGKAAAAAAPGKPAGAGARGAAKAPAATTTTTKPATKTAPAASPAAAPAPSSPASPSRSGVAPRPASAKATVKSRK